MDIKMTEKSFEILMQKMGEYDSPNDAKMGLDSIVASLTQVLINGEDIVLEGLGSFKVVEDEVPMRGPTKIPGYSYPDKEILTPRQLKEDMHKHYHLVKSVKVVFDKTLEQKINKVKQ